VGAERETGGARSAKLAAGLSLDLDNEWSYLKTHGEASWSSYPSYLDTLIPYALDALDELGLRITFFIVGKDASLERNAEALGMLTARGHEVGNHSFRHEPWLHLYAPDQIRRELALTEEHVERVTGARPIGFRGPGFSTSPTVLQVLAERGYLYDASTLPTYLGPLARMYYFRTARLSPEEKTERKQLFGKLADGRRPVEPYQWVLASGGYLLELPVTTMPVTKTPFHLSYLLYLSRFSEVAMWTYLETVIAACKLTRTPISFLLHPLDLLTGDQVSPELAFFPGMDVARDRKRALFMRVLRRLGAAFDLRPMSAFAHGVLDRGGLETRHASTELG